MADSETTKGDDTSKKGEVHRIVPLIIERGLAGVANGYIDIAERVVNGQTEVKSASVAVHSLDGVSKVAKQAIDAAKLFDSGSIHSRKLMADFLGVNLKAIENKSGNGEDNKS